MDNETQIALDDWADQIAKLDPAVRRGIVEAVTRLAEDSRISPTDRDFATAQAAAISRATNRRRPTRPKPRNSSQKNNTDT